MKKVTIQYPDFQKLEILVGEIKDAKRVEGSNKLIQLSVDLGKEYGVVTILSGIAESYKPEKLIGNKYAVVANLQPKKMFGLYSNGMIMAAEDGAKVVLVKLPKKLTNGSVIY